MRYESIDPAPPSPEFTPNMPTETPHTSHLRTQRILALVGAFLFAAAVPLVSCVGCSSRTARTLPAPRAGSLAYERKYDEVMIAGQLFHTGAPVVLWSDPGGYDAYRVEKRFTPWAESAWDAMVKAGKAPDSPARYNTRAAALSTDELERVRGGGWDLPLLQRTVDQFVIHYDVCGTSRQCFKVLHDLRGLSVHFMLDIDGTIYQTLDLKERAWHATTSNDRSVGIEIANMGAYAIGERDPFSRWYSSDDSGDVRITIPDDLGDGGIRTANFIGRPDRQEIVVGGIHDRALRQYDFTPQQYDSLIRLTAALHKALPKIRLEIPRNASGEVLDTTLPDDQLKAFTGVLGHFHMQGDKSDPGPALQWERVMNGAKAIVGDSAKTDQKANN